MQSSSLPYFHPLLNARAHNTDRVSLGVSYFANTRQRFTYTLSLVTELRRLCHDNDDSEFQHVSPETGDQTVETRYDRTYAEDNGGQCDCELRVFRTNCRGWRCDAVDRKEHGWKRQQLCTGSAWTIDKTLNNLHALIQSVAKGYTSQLVTWSTRYSPWWHDVTSWPGRSSWTCWKPL